MVTRHYAVGSFDDDASYLMTARALAHGTPLTGTLPIGYPVVATYPPGFALLLAPLAAVAGPATWPYQALVLPCFLALFPLTHLWLRRAGAPRWLAAGVLLLLALSPLAATFATMVMAEAPFLVVLLGAFLAAQRWAGQDRALTAGRGGHGAAGRGPALAQAGGHRAGRGPRAVAAAAGPVAPGGRAGRRGGPGVAPVLVLRAAAGAALAGARYSSEIGGFGGLGVVPDGWAQYLCVALPDTVLPLVDVPRYVFVAVAWTVPVFVVLGIGAALRRRSGPATVATLVYLAETLLYPYINERRLILVLPVVLAWYVAGVGLAVREAAWFAGRHRAAARRGGRGGDAAGRRPAAVAVRPALHPRDGAGQRPAAQLGLPGLRRRGDRAAGRRRDAVRVDDVAGHRPGGRERPVLPVRPARLLGRRPAGRRGRRPGRLRRGRGVERAAAGGGVPGAGARRGPLGGPPLPRRGQTDVSVWEFVGPGTVHPFLSDAVGGLGAVGTEGDAPRSPGRGLGPGRSPSCP